MKLTEVKVAYILGNLWQGNKPFEKTFIFEIRISKRMKFYCKKLKSGYGNKMDLAK